MYQIMFDCLLLLLLTGLLLRSKLVPTGIPAFLDALSSASDWLSTFQTASLGTAEWK